MYWDSGILGDPLVSIENDCIEEGANDRGNFSGSSTCKGFELFPSRVGAVLLSGSVLTLVVEVWLSSET